MATTTRLVTTFMCADGKSHNFSHNYAKKSTSANQVKTLAAAMIANGSIFANVPYTLQSAKLSTNETTEFDLSD